MPIAMGRDLSRLLPVCLVLLGAAEAVAIHIWNPAPRIPIIQFAYGLTTLVIVLYLGRARSSVEAPAWTVAALLGGTFLVAALVAQFALDAYPVSGDEYGYTFVADTLLHGRLWNHAYPASIQDVLATNYIGGHGDQRLSQYAPGWPVVMMPFRWAGIAQFANAVIGLIAAGLLWQALRCVPVPRTVRLAALTLGIAAPFTIFNNASFFSHPLTAAALLGIIWLDVRDPLHPTPWNRIGIGVGFSILLATRAETLFLAFLPFVIDGFCRHRARFVGWALPAALGATPATLLFLAYNWQITGSPFTSTITWITPQLGYGLHAMGMDGPHSVQRAIQHTLEWFANWQDFASVLLLPFYAVALYYRLTTRTLRWFDLIFPAVVIFFFFFPDNGGFQYGPRYWYIAAVAMPITIAAGLPTAGEFWRLRHWRFDPLRLAAAQLASFAGFTIGYAVFLHLQVDNRLAPFRLADTVRPPAILLMETIGRRYVPWQGYAYQLFPKDYTRNGVDSLGPIVIGLDLGAERTARLCAQMPDRAIYRIQLNHVGPSGTVQPVCNGALDP